MCSKTRFLEGRDSKIFINVHPFNFALSFLIGSLFNMDPAKSKRMCTNPESFPSDTCGKLQTKVRSSRSRGWGHGEGAVEGQQGLCLVGLCWPVSNSPSTSDSYRKDILKIQSLCITFPVWIKCLSWGKKKSYR